MKARTTHSELRWLKWLLPLYCIKYCFHILEFYRYLKWVPEIERDLFNEAIQNGAPIFSRKRSLYFQIYAVVWGMAYDPYYLTLFYTRLKGQKEYLRIIKSDYSSLYFLTNDIGKNFTMHHPYSTVINAKHVGDNCVIKNNTTIGNINEDNNKRPWIGDNVFIGANVVIFGDIRIGNNVTIGAGSVVNKDVPDNAVVVGNPMKILSTTDGYKGVENWQETYKKNTMLSLKNISIE